MPAKKPTTTPDPVGQTDAEMVLDAAVTRAVAMYRAGADEEAVYWTLLHAGLTADLLGVT